VISIAADIVPITGENRILAAAGLERLNLGTLRPGIQKILDKAGKKIPLNIEDIVFGIAPRINAAGRIESGNRAVELLLTNDLVSAERIALLIDDHNTTRKNLDAKITSEALEQIRCDLSLDGDQPRRTTVLYHPEWHKGVVGIVASRLMESYYRPTIVLTESNGKVVGSARSVRGFNVYEAIEKCSDLLEQFGGHFYAAGLTLTHENVKAFQQKFEEIVSQSITDDQLQPQINVDAELEFSEIFQGSKSAVPEFFKFLKMLSPFGPDNMNPVFISKNVYDTGYATVLKEKHLKMSLVQESNPKIIMSAIAFGMADRYEEIKGKPFDVVYSIEENNWNGRTSLQLMVKEIVV
jgi:single-stranded-DNA-specific exonuclease